MSGLNKVVWAEGVFLGQQHFQTWDSYNNARQLFTMRSHQLYHWGVAVLEWNSHALKDGRLELKKLQAIFPNGQVIDFYSGVDDSVSIDLGSLSRDEVIVSVAVPDNPLVEGVAGYQSAGRIGGWLACYQEVADDSDATRKREVMTAKPNIKLRTDSESLENMQSIRLAKVSRQYDGTYQIDGDLIPPCLHVNATPVLRDLSQGMTDMLASLVREFSRSRQKIGDIGSYSTSELSDFLLQKELATVLPEFKTISTTGRTHPFHLYQSLCALHQAVAAYVDPESLEAYVEYNHNALEECLPWLVNEIRRMIAGQKERPEAKIALNALSPGRFESTEIPRHTLESYSFYLAVDAKQDSIDWVGRFTQMIKIAAPEQLETILASGLPGVAIRHAQRLPQKIRIKSGYEYFRLSTDSELWHSVMQQQKFGVFCLGEFADADIELIVLDES